MSAWNDFVKKIYHEGHNKDPNYSFKQALKDASRRKSEMGSSSAVTAPKSKSKKHRKSTKKSGRKSRGTRRRRH